MLIDRIIARQQASIESEPIVIGLRADVARLERDLAIARGRQTGKRAAREHAERVRVKTAQIAREIGR